MDGAATTTIHAADVPRDVADQIIVARIREATAANLGRAADCIHEYYHTDESKRPGAELALGDALGVDQLAFGVAGA